MVSRNLKRSRNNRQSRRLKRNGNTKRRTKRRYTKKRKYTKKKMRGGGGTDRLASIAKTMGMTVDQMPDITRSMNEEQIVEFLAQRVVPAPAPAPAPARTAPAPEPAQKFEAVARGPAVVRRDPPKAKSARCPDCDGGNGGHEQWCSRG